MSVESNRYDASALVNKGNCMLQRGDMEGARDCCLEAVGVEADCVDAIYNLGLVNKRLEQYQDALVNFRKVISIIPNDPEALGSSRTCASSWGTGPWRSSSSTSCTRGFPPTPGCQQSSARFTPRRVTRPRLCNATTSRTGVYPPNIPVIEWLGTYHAQQRAYEKAHEFFAFTSEDKPGYQVAAPRRAASEGR